MEKIDRQQWNAMIALFLEWNSKINLSAIRDADGVREKHILDSLELTKLIDIEDGLTCLDLGTGWWFPLLPLAQAFPQVQFTGIDARKKKVEVVGQMINALWITNATTVWWRVEEYKQSYDLVVTRAVAYADQLFTRALPRVKKWGLLVLYKLFTEEEDYRILSLMRQHNLEPIVLHEYRLEHDTPEVKRILYVMKKN